MKCKHGLNDDSLHAFHLPIRIFVLNDLTMLVDADPKQIAVRAGHTSVSVVLDRYGHLFPQHDALLQSTGVPAVVDGVEVTPRAELPQRTQQTTQIVSMLIGL